INLTQDGQNLDEQEGEPVGSVKISVNAPQEDVLQRHMAVGLQDGENKIVVFSQVDAKGTATFQNVSAGKYGLRVFAQGKTYSVVRMSSKGAQVSGHEFTLTPGESQEWSVALAEGKANIEGFVKRGGKAVPGVMVVLIPKDPELHEDLFRRDQSDLDGSFELPNVIPGSYTIAAVDDAWGFDWSKPGLLARYAIRGEALTIGQQMQRIVNLPEPVEVQPR
ncbi:MAG: MSCRAMM family protein, partial [Candidatus Acidiferrum sp.]